MGETLHIETDSVSACANRLYIEADDIQQQLRALLVVVRSVEWYGPNREYFQAEFEQLIHHAIYYTESAQTLAVRLETEVDQWQAVDWMYSQQFSNFVLPDIGRRQI